MLTAIAHASRHLHSHGEMPIGVLVIAVLFVAGVSYLLTRGAGQ